MRTQFATNSAQVSPRRTAEGFSTKRDLTFLKEEKLGQ